MLPCQHHHNDCETKRSHQEEYSEATQWLSCTTKTSKQALLLLLFSTEWFGKNKIYCWQRHTQETSTQLLKPWKVYIWFALLFICLHQNDQVISSELMFQMRNSVNTALSSETSIKINRKYEILSKYKP